MIVVIRILGVLGVLSGAWAWVTGSTLIGMGVMVAGLAALILTA